jgi:hypothetical protein
VSASHRVRAGPARLPPPDLSATGLQPGDERATPRPAGVVGRRSPFLQDVQRWAWKALSPPPPRTAVVVELAVALTGSAMWSACDKRNTWQREIDQILKNMSIIVVTSGSRVQNRGREDMPWRMRMCREEGEAAGRGRGHCCLWSN